VKLLGIETSSNVGSVALLIGDDVREREMASPREQTAQLLRLVDESLVAAGLVLADLDGIAFGRGPGSFTGLRVAAAVAQGLALASGVPLLPVSSLQCLAQTAFRMQQAERVLACVDARMGEVYWAEFALDAGVLRTVGGERLGIPSDVAVPAERPWAAVGGGFASYCDALSGALALAALRLPDLKPAAEDLFPQARLDLAAGRSVTPAEALPVYLREHTAWRRSS
jgi:tRNA threonylcarbamoyladenosine biosynthesis protein TsaB